MHYPDNFKKGDFIGLELLERGEKGWNILGTITKAEPQLHGWLLEFNCGTRNKMIMIEYGHYLYGICHTF